MDELADKTSLLPDDIGEYTGDAKEIRPVTVTTYQILTYHKRRPKLRRYEGGPPGPGDGDGENEEVAAPDSAQNGEVNVAGYAGGMPGSTVGVISGVPDPKTGAQLDWVVGPGPVGTADAGAGMGDEAADEDYLSLEEYPHFKVFNERDWGLIVYDEVHLLPAPVFRMTAELQGRRRLGLTAHTGARRWARRGRVCADRPQTLRCPVEGPRAPGLDCDRTLPRAEAEYDARTPVGVRPGRQQTAVLRRGPGPGQNGRG